MYPPSLFAVNIKAGSGMVLSEPDSSKLEVSTTAGDGSEDLVQGRRWAKGRGRRRWARGRDIPLTPQPPTPRAILTTFRPFLLLHGADKVGGFGLISALFRCASIS